MFGSLSEGRGGMPMDAPNKEFTLAGSLEELKAKGRLVVHGRRRRTPPISTGLSALVTDRAMEAWYHPPIA
jgi:hypothetical protein